MQNQLDVYLAEFSKRLSKMPAAVRDEEILELRKHLEAAFAAGCERGLSEIDAARAAIQNFGPVDEVAAEVTRVWRRGERSMDLRSFLGAVACYEVCNSVVAQIENSVHGLNNVLYHAAESVMQGGIQGLLVLLLLLLVMLVLIALPAALIGFVFPRKGALAIAVFMAGGSTIGVCKLVYRHPQEAHGFGVQGIEILGAMLAISSISVFIARVFSRLRLRSVRDHFKEIPTPLIVVILFFGSAACYLRPNVQYVSPNLQHPAPVVDSPTPPAGWSVVDSFTGDNANSMTVPFSVGPEWKLKYTTKASSYAGSQGYFVVIISGQGRSRVATGHHLGSSSGEVLEHGAGTYSLSICTTQPYSIHVLNEN